MKRNILIILLGATLTFSCKEILKDVEPQFTQDAENFFNTPADYERALIGAYDLMQNSYLDLWIGEIASDNSIAGGNSVNDTPGLHEIDEMTHNGVNTELRSILRNNYTGISRANFIFENKDKIDFEGKDEVLAQASFLRGYYYFQLVKTFGDMPLVVDRRLSIDEATGLGRTAATEVYAQIETDLINASDVLPWTQAVKGRITKGAALALLGKVYLYQDKFDESATALDRVITEGAGAAGYDLDPNFDQIFLANNEGSPETVFDIQYSGNEGGSYGCFVCLEGFAAVGFHAPKLFDGPVYGDGNSYNLPTADLFNAFDASDSRRDASILDIDAFIAANPGTTYQIEAGGHTGYYNNKYIKRKGETGLPDDDLTSPINHKKIRFADVLLMAAEAHNRGAGSDATANGYVRRVRERVGLTHLDLSGQALTQAIWDERRLELSGEGVRFFDLVRTGQAASEIDGFVVGKHELFPIPQAEIDLSGMSQNPMY